MAGSVTGAGLDGRETEYLVFREEARSGKTRVFTVWSKRGGFVLGSIGWFGRWRGFVFAPAHDTVFNSGCMDDLSQFCKDAYKDWRESRADDHGGSS